MWLKGKGSFFVKGPEESLEFLILRSGVKADKSHG